MRKRGCSARAGQRSSAAAIVAKGEVVDARSPIDRDIILGEFPQANAALIDEAVSAARAAYPAWRDLGWPRRVAFLRAGADVLEQRKWDVSVACLIEVGKSRLEAVGEVEEAIDLIRHYCDEMERTDGFREERAGASSAEKCSVVLRPYGVFGVIAPFNFPVALSLGMMSAALVAGNTVVFKPSDAAGLTGRLVVEALLEGGLPDGVLNLVQGGRATGEALVRHSGVDGFAFTGSNAVGMTHPSQFGFVAGDAPRARRNGREEPGLRHGKRGPECRGVRRRAVGIRLAGPEMQRRVQGLCRARHPRRLSRRFDRNGQQSRHRRPSAAGRVHGARSSTRPRSIDSPRRSKTRRTSGSVVLGGQQLAGGLFDKGPYVPPTIVSGLAADHRINRDELFLPFLSVLPFDNLDDAIADANRSAFGLTAGIYTQDQRGTRPVPDHDRGGCPLRQPRQRSDDRRVARLPDVLRLEGSGTSGKGGLGSWYVPQFMREQSHTIFGTL